MESARTIDEVIVRLDDVIAAARRDRSRLGYFAVLYRNVTAGVKQGIIEERFQDGARMERLDVIFANRYLHALDAYRRGERTSGCWVAAFRAAESRRPLILQHLLLGISAHINLDLGIAAAETSPGAELAGLKNDFDQINRFLGAMLDDVQERIAAVSPWMGILDRLGMRSDEEICTFCLERSRDVAWMTATRLAGVRREQLPGEIEKVDGIVSALAGPIRSPGLLLAPFLLLVRLRESGDVTRVIDALEYPAHAKARAA